MIFFSASGSIWFVRSWRPAVQAGPAVLHTVEDIQVELPVHTWQQNMNRTAGKGSEQVTARFYQEVKNKQEESFKIFGTCQQREAKTATNKSQHTLCSRLSSLAWPPGADGGFSPATSAHTTQHLPLPVGQRAHSPHPRQQTRPFKVQLRSNIRIYIFI